MAFRLAGVNQILDPWLYIILRKEMLVKVYKFYRKKRYGDDTESTTHSNTTEYSSGSVRGNIRLQSLSPQQKRILSKMNSTDSSATYVPK
jgi:hypothetical protein